MRNGNSNTQGRASVPSQIQDRDIPDEIRLRSEIQSQGRDIIGPDEIRLRDGEQKQAGNIAEDSDCFKTNPESSRNNHLPGQGLPHNWHRFHEVMDESTSSRRHLDVKREEDRLSTFSEWRYQATIRKEDLARDGFVYTGSSDKVRCVFCNILIRQWEPQDVVQPVHRRFSPNCPFVLGHDVGNMPMQPRAAQGSNPSGCQQAPSASVSEQIQTQNPLESGRHGSVHQMLSSSSSSLSSLSLPEHPSMTTEPQRLATFQNWPMQMKQRPEQLAHAGLFYTAVADRVVCFQCGILLYHWESRDDPFWEHARHSPKCAYVRLAKGEQFIADVLKQGAMNEEEVMMDTAAVQALLFDGYSKETIQKALAVLKIRNVAADRVTAEMLVLTIMDIEQPARAQSSTSANVSSTVQHSGDLMQLHLENESLREKQQCKVCMDREVEVIFYPCKHLVCCSSCAFGVSECPICRVPIQNRERVFMA